jgi:hypothetical protein
MKDRVKYYDEDLHVPLSTPEKQELEAAAGEEKTPMTHLVRSLITEYLRERRRQKHAHPHRH